MADGILHPRFLANLRAALADKGWTQRDLAHAMGHTDAWASQVMNGRTRPHFAVIERIAETLDIDPGELLQPIHERISA